MRKKETDFLHELASPLTGVEMILESLFYDMPPSDDLFLSDRVKEAITGLHKMKIALEKRREEVTHEN